MEPRPFIIYKSSAGSGKTYTLTMEYLKLALRYRDAYKGILAVTFTNKATQEMKMRILEVLERLTREINRGEKLDEELLNHLQLNEGQLQDRAKEVLTQLIHHYADFSVSTIDSFFQKVVRAFAREIDLQAKFDVELDQEAVLERLVDRLMVKVADDASLHRWLVDYADEKIRDGKSWDIRHNIKDLGMQLFQEDFKQHSHEIQAFLADPQSILDFRSKLFGSIRQIQKRLEEIYQEVLAIFEQYGLTLEDFKYKGSSVPAVFFKLPQEKGVPELTKRPLDGVDNVDLWLGKDKCAEVAQAFEAGLNDLLKELIGLEPQWNTLKAISRNFYVFGIFSELLEELKALKEEENIMLISDANEFLKEITADSDAPFIYEKVGNQYRNYLIDEFQDTSGFQWAGFYPLLENSLASGNTNLIVGDVKQSIYRWRGGDLTLLLREVERQIGPDRVQLKNLDTNFRSLPHIVGFNNALFGRLVLGMMAAAHEKYGLGEERLQAIRNAYQEVRQNVAPHKQKSDFKGKVQLEFLEGDKEVKFEEQALEKLPSMVQTLQDKGFQLKDIAILIRRKVEGQMVADTLMEYAAGHPDDGYRYEVLSDEAMFLYKSATVKCLVAALTYLNHPEDDVAFRTFWFHRESLREITAYHELFAKNEAAHSLEEERRAFESQKDELIQLPLYELVEELVDRLGLNQMAKERAYLSAFKEAVYDFVANNRSDIGAFLEWWTLNKEKRTVKIPDGHDAIRILTIHKSKGLQFKVVLMPMMDWDIFSSKGVIWATYQNGDTQEPVVPLSLTSALAKTDFSERYREEVMLAFLDSLNMIYVALTRAEEVFWGLAPGHKGKDPWNKLAFNIQMAIQQSLGMEEELELNSLYDPEEGILNIGEWPQYPPSESKGMVPPVLSWGHRTWGELLKVKKSTGDISEEKAALSTKRNYGVLIHRLLERLEKQDQLEELLQEAYFKGQLTDEEKFTVKARLERLFEQPLMQSWFREQAEVLTEQGILLPGGSSIRPDRVVRKKNKVVVIDFKTGGPKPGHTEQVEAYMAHVEELERAFTEGYLVYIDDARIEQVLPKHGN